MGSSSLLQLKLDILVPQILLVYKLCSLRFAVVKSPSAVLRIHLIQKS